MQPLLLHSVSCWDMTRLRRSWILISVSGYEGDGRLSPTDLVLRAHRNGVNVLALTDHDTMEGVPVALKVARDLGMRLIPGVEISAKFASTSQLQRGEEENVHILAYFSCCGPAHPEELEACLNKIREGRYTRAKRMVQKLKALNKPVKWESVLDIAGDGVAPCRPHVARALLEAGHVDTIGEAFTRFLRDSGPAYVAGAEQPAEEVVRLIHRTGGIAVLAHPWSLKNPSPLIDRLKDAGLDGMEVYRSGGKDPAWVTCAGNLLKVGGSDYHASGAVEETDVGGIALPAGTMLQFLTTAQPIWISALRVILEEFAQSDLETVLSASLSWKGDITIRKLEKEVLLILSPLLDGEEERALVQNEALRLGLSHSIVREQGFDCCAVSRQL
ncbi:uncharacterized protein [Physcomitrium patens]|uniref:Polymerase/histidinol phosphatase N-terminal domain-containing protein n=1 Tax=Physcomitrium patens TaxID=3218 RepID=A0A7I4E289_PHYPA|nr:uncharacterized protein LOC112283169 isoform X2 [Physcomitrium patens]|eukprot:XP_024377329.1 uncharacterized protein LOC112283169 isoform X2 [Physcomitrella patens]